MPAASRRRRTAPRVIGQPIQVTQPRLRDVRWRYCARWNERPAAVLGQSFLRLGVAKPADWSGSAVDFVETAFQRFCRENGSAEAASVWVGDLRIMDGLFELTERERNELAPEDDGCVRYLYLVGDYEAAASIPIGAILERLEGQDKRLPAAFFEVFRTNLYKWMRVYDVLDAREHAECWSEDLTEEELKDVVYARVDPEIPACIGNHAGELSYATARRWLLRFVPQTPMSRRLVRHLLHMDAKGQGHKHAWPDRLAERDLPALGDWLADAESSRPGCLISWYEGDAISACFEEEAQHMGENGPCLPNVVLPIRLDQPAKKLDEQVRIVLEHVRAMLRSLAAAARIVETIREVYDEHLREHRLQSGIPFEPGVAGIRHDEL